MISLRPLDQAYIKRHNIESLLSMLERCQPVSRSRLAQLTEMSSASVTRFTGALTALGLVNETSVCDAAGRGRRAVNLSTAPDGMYTLGCHFDTHSLRLCLMDFSNRIRGVREIVLSPSDLRPERLAEIAAQQAAHLKPAAADRLRGAGVSVSGRIDNRTNRVSESRAFEWVNMDLATPFSAALGLPMLVENDVRACLTWEGMRMGMLDKDQDCAYLYLGRAGIGFSNSVGGRIVRGLNNSAGEIEEVFMNMNDRLDDHLREVSLVTKARRFSPSVSSIGDILKAHRMGLTWAKLLMDDFIGHLNILLQLIRAMLDPHCLILGGDMTDALRTMPGLLPEGQFSFGELFEDSCARGAAVIAMRSALHTCLEAAMESPGAPPEEGGDDQ